MTITINIATSTGTININNNTDKPITSNIRLLNNSPNVYIPTKVCNTCRTIKCVTEFYKDKSKKDGYHSQCKICNDNRKQIYLEENKDQISNARNNIIIKTKIKLQSIEKNTMKKIKINY